MMNQFYDVRGSRSRSEQLHLLYCSLEPDVMLNLKKLSDVGTVAFLCTFACFHVSELLNTRAKVGQHYI